MMRIFWFFSLGFCGFAAGGVTLDGLPGVRGTYSGETLGHGRLIFQGAAEGHVDVNQVNDKTFLRYRTTNPAEIPDTLVIQQLQSTSLRFSAAVGLSRFLDLGISLPFYADFISETDAEKLTQSGLGELALAAKLRVPLGKTSPVDIGLFGSAEIPVGTQKQGILPRSVANLQDTLPISPEFSSGSPFYSTRLLFTLNPARLTQALPLKLHIQPGWRIYNQEGSSDLFLLNAGIEWQVGAVLALYAEWETQSPLSPPEGGLRIGADYSSLSLGVVVSGDHAARFQLGATLPLPNNPGSEFFREVEGHGTFRYTARAQPGFSLWAGVFFSIETVPSEPDGVPGQTYSGTGFCPDCGMDAPHTTAVLSQSDSCAQGLLSQEVCYPPLKRASLAPKPVAVVPVPLPPPEPDTIWVEDTTALAAMSPEPEIEEEQSEPFPKTLSIPEVQFSDLGYRILPVSYRSLDDLARLLLRHPDVEIELKAFASGNVEEVAAYGLSHNRALAIKEYLVKRNIVESRLHARGMGIRQAGVMAAPDITGRAVFSLLEIYRLD